MTALRNLIRALLSLPDGAVRPADQAAPTGVQPFLTVRELTSVEVAAARRDFDAGHERETIRQSMETLVSVNAYGTAAGALMRKLRAMLRSTEGITGMKAMGGALLRVSPARNLSAAVGAGQEERAQMDLTISHTHLVSVEQRRIESATVRAETGAGLQQATTITEY